MCDCNDSNFSKLRSTWSRYQKTNCDCKQRCAKPKIKGKFGVAYVIKTPDCECQPCGWEIEFDDTPSQIDNNCQKMVDWITKPPLNGCCQRICPCSTTLRQSMMRQQCCCKNCCTRHRCADKEKGEFCCSHPTKKRFQTRGCDCCCGTNAQKAYFQSRKQQCCSFHRQSNNDMQNCCCKSYLETPPCCCCCNSDPTWNVEDGKEENPNASCQCPSEKPSQHQKPEKADEHYSHHQVNDKQSKNYLSPEDKDEKQKLTSRSPYTMSTTLIPKKGPDITPPAEEYEVKHIDYSSNLEKPPVKKIKKSDLLKKIKAEHKKEMEAIHPTLANK